MAARLSALHAIRPLVSGKFVVLRGSVDPRAIVRLEELGQLKNPMTSLGIEPTCLHHSASTKFENQYLGMGHSVFRLYTESASNR
jgi:hypothetical protein